RALTTLPAATGNFAPRCGSSTGKGMLQPPPDRNWDCLPQRSARRIKQMHALLRQSNMDFPMQCQVRRAVEFYDDYRALYRSLRPPLLVSKSRHSLTVERMW